MNNHFTLVASGLRVAYGDITAVWDLDLAVAPGRIVCILGRNGAGKTTTLHALAGLLTVTQGSIQLAGQEITDIPPYKRVSMGLSLVQEGKQIFRNLTVEENLVVGGYSRNVRRRLLRQAIEREYERFPMLAERRRSRAGSLSGGQQQMLAVAQALLAEPKVLMLDEPSAGLAPGIVATVFEGIQRLRADGMGILLVEQLAEQALGVADEVLVMDVGRIIMRHNTDDGRDLEILQAAYFGRR